MNTTIIEAYTSGTIFTLEGESQLGIECHCEEQRPSVIDAAKANKGEVIQWLIDNDLAGQRFNLERSVLDAYKAGVSFRLDDGVLTVRNPDNDINGALIEAMASHSLSAVVRAVASMEAKRKLLMKASGKGLACFKASEKREIRSVAELFGVELEWTRIQI